MKFIADKEGREALFQLCDIALKVGGLNSMEGIQKILKSIEVKDDESKEK